MLSSQTEPPSFIRGQLSFKGHTETTICRHLLNCILTRSKFWCDALLFALSLDDLKSLHGLMVRNNYARTRSNDCRFLLSNAGDGIAKILFMVHRNLRDA